MPLEQTHIVITFGLVILIWIIQLVHYPSFVYYDNFDFHKAMLHHQRWISVITMPLMISEMALTLLFFFKYQNLNSLVCVISIFVIWTSTFFVQVPLHKKISHNKDLGLIKKLVVSNWVRTIAWSFKFIVLAYQLF